MHLQAQQTEQLEAENAKLDEGILKERRSRDRSAQQYEKLEADYARGEERRKAAEEAARSTKAEITRLAAVIAEAEQVCACTLPSPIVPSTVWHRMSFSKQRTSWGALVFLASSCVCCTLLLAPLSINACIYRMARSMASWPLSVSE